MMKETDLSLLPEGTVCTPRGFIAGAIHVAVRTDWEKLDVGLLSSEAPCVAAAVTTRNRVPGASLVISRQHLSGGRAQAVIANAGCANASTGKRGLDDAIRLAQAAGEKLGIDPHLAVVASTGVIGTYLPMDRILPGIQKIALSAEGGVDFARALMTTDTRPKHVAVRSANWSIGGVVKGVGMIHPNMATMLCFVTTDASVRQPFLQKALEAAVDDSFNMIDVDSDTSPDDIALVLANSLAGGEAIDEGHREAPAFAVALKQLCVYLAKAMIADAEGATKTIEAQVGGAASAEDARRAARAIISSLGVKTAVYGKDPNWGRVLSAIGNSGAEVQEERTKLFLATPDDGEICLFAGVPQGFDPAQAKACLESESIRFRIDLGLGEAAATAWGSDLTEDYVRLNSEYTT